ncbi:unnamed protein product [Notodromas monacha]|uniref:N-acetyltransferase domain-containing protein n=1 Tax=Notodromas monacha TaxID=399045 RepID=A0A7R9BMW9_9CRUS|nr:unnamed protein product [Notodromas monacha]CAG0916943.1 unnamed protein product [Notodromas monacha]
MESKVLPVTIDGIKYDLLQPEDQEVAADLVVNDFCLTEPCSRSLGIQPEESLPIVKLICARGIADRVSLKAEDATTGELVGLRVSLLRRRDAKGADEAEFRDCLQQVPTRLHPFADFIANHSGGEAAADIFGTYGVDQYVEFFLVNVHQAYRGKQIAQRILQLCYDLYREMGVHIVKVLATNPRTNHIFRKQGFQEISNYPVMNFMHDGRRYFENMEETENAFTFVKDLRK